MSPFASFHFSISIEGMGKSCKDSLLAHPPSISVALQGSNPSASLSVKPQVRAILSVRIPPADSSRVPIPSH